MAPELLWLRVKSCFENDDGSFPTIEIANLTPAEVGEVYSYVRSSAVVANPEASFWDRVDGVDRNLDDVPNAGLWVAERRAAPFHFAVDGIHVNGIALPRLGMHIFQDLIAIDYQMGADWNPHNVSAFFSFLRSLVARTASGVVRASASEAPPEDIAFIEAWNDFAKQHAQ